MFCLQTRENMSTIAMGDEIYERKFNEMQRYIPFLERVIEKLKNNEQDKPRKAQLEKMQMLHNLLTNKQKKLKSETLLKCESVLKKLHAKIEKSDEPPNTTKKTSTTVATVNTSSAEPSKEFTVLSKIQPTHTTSPPSSKLVPKSKKLIEINTCPASPTQFGDEDFRPPVEIPTERRCSPVRDTPGIHWEASIGNNLHQEHNKPPGAGPQRFQNRSSDYYHDNNFRYQQQHQPPVDRQRNSHTRWPDSREWVPETELIMPSSNSSSYHRPWTASSSSSLSSNQRSHGQQRNENKKNYSSEEENWDDPEDEQPPQKSTTRPPSLRPLSPASSSSSHFQHREPNHSQSQHRHHEKANKHSRDFPPQLPPSFPPLPDITLDKETFQMKLYHDTIYRYKKPDPLFMNPPPPEASANNIFNRLGDKLDRGFENFRIEVKNDKMKPKLPKSIPAQHSPIVPIKPIDEVLKSPPLSADDIDDLLNESLEAANENPKSKPFEFTQDRKATALEVVRKKLAMISKAPAPEIDSPPSINKAQEEKEPFYRRGHAPIQTATEPIIHNTRPRSPQLELLISSQKNFSESSPKSPQNPIDPIIERLALKYNPHRRRDSMLQENPKHNTYNITDKPDIQSPTIRDHSIGSSPGGEDRLALKYNPHPRRETIISPARVVDPRIGKIMGPISPLINSPIPVSPVPNVLPTINPYDPRLRNSRLTGVDPTPSGPFCSPIPYPSPIPSLLDINVTHPLPNAGVPLKNPFVAPTPSRLDPRKQKSAAAIYAEKFNPERNDQTERMKYLESKKNKPPEPKTYGEYKQSKCRQKADEEAAKAKLMIDSIAVTPSVLSTTPSTLDKMYRNADYGKELVGNIHGFKIPKKPKPEEPKIEPKKKEDNPKSEESGKTVEEPLKKQEEQIKKLDDMNKSEKQVKKHEETEEDSKKQDHSPNKLNKPEKPTADEISKMNNTSESLNESKSESDLVIDEDPPEPIVPPKRRPGRPKTIKKEIIPEDTKPNNPLPQLEKDSEEAKEEKLILPRVATRRSTILKDPPKDEDDKNNETSSPSLTPCRSASDIFSPTTDNSIVSTQNIITGKRRTRASINFNEKATKKPATPKTSPTTSSNAVVKVPGKPGPKPGTKKPIPGTPKTRRRTGGKQTSDDGQICAVSSTTSQGGDADESHNNNSISTEEAGSLEEPSSSGSKPQTPSIDADENKKKQEWLEGFLKSIVDPTTNKDRILDMLKTVLDEKKLQQVKDILYSPEDEGKDAPENAKKSQEQNKPRTIRTKKNELDRLNEDIRDMFICQGVVTATGRRMCTLAKETSKEKPAKSKERNTQLKGNITATSPSPIPPGKRRMRRAKVMISPLNIRALRSRSRRGGSRPPEMPVLEPNTPIKLPDEDDDECIDNEDAKVVEPFKRKPGPKTKRSASLALESEDDDDDIQLVHLKKKIKSKVQDDEEGKSNEDEKEEEQREEPEEEEQKQKDSQPLEEDKKMEEDDKETVEKKVEEQVTLKPKEELPKNINPDWHTMSDYASCCVICKEKSRYIAPHYLICHNDSEVYTSRLPPSILEDLKRDIGNRALYSVPKKPNLVAFHYRCPFCDFQSTSTLRGWMEHFTIHTGEYQYKCSGCFKAMNGCTHLVEHIKKFCPEAKKINREPVNLRGHTINGYVCHLCNFTQMLHSGVVRHLKIQHQIEDAASIERIIEVRLIDSAGVPKMEENKSSTEPIEGILAPPPPLPSPSVTNTKESSLSNESNMEVFLSRELASPTSDVLTERLKSIDQDDGITSDSSVNTVSPFKDGQAPATRITIAERLSQRFKNIEKQNMLEDERIENSTNPPQAEEGSKETNEGSGKLNSNSMVVDEAPPLTDSDPVDATVPVPETAPVPCPTTSVSELGSIVNVEENGNKSKANGNGSESEWADENDEDDNENWEDIEITETKSSSQKDKNKNKSIFQTLSRLYASIAPRKGSRKSKDKERKKMDSPQPKEKPTKTSELPPIPQPTSAPTAPPLPPQISNLSDLLPDSPSDSLDMLLATNFNSLEGDGTSFPHLDLNDLDSPIFLLSEEQSNLQEAIAMATDSDQIKYDVLGDPLPTPSVQAPLQVSSSTSAQRIGYVGFSLSGDAVKYYCMVTACTFLFSDHPDGLQNHFLLEHPTLRWNGFCHTCQMQVCPDGSSEMQHMLDVHSKARTEDQSGEKPRIKFRRLTGDILSTGNQPLSPLPSPPAPAIIRPEAQTKELCLSAMLLSEPKAMTQPTPPSSFESEIPLYKNVSKEFTITAVAEGVTDDDLRNLVLNQAESTPGGMQISQVISLNAGGKSVNSTKMSMDYNQITDIIPTYTHLNSPSVLEHHGALQCPENLTQNNPSTSLQTNVPLSSSVSQLNQDIIATTSQGNSLGSTKVVPSKRFAFKCCATNCQFSTNLRSAMNEHLLLHMRTDNDRESLKCHECAFMSRNITEYFQHSAKHGHSSSTSPPSCPSTHELTQKIQDILRATSNSGKSSEEDTNSVDLLPNKKSFAERLRAVAEETVAHTGMPDSKVWKCPLYPECTRPVTEKDFQTHIAKHMSSAYPSRTPGSSLSCPHCTANYLRPALLKAHIKSHARHQYFCYVCCSTFMNFQQTQKHCNDIHFCYNRVFSQPLIPEGEPGKPCFYIVSGEKLTAIEVMRFGEKLLAEWERKKALNKTHFQPHEHHLLPLQPIFNNQVFCSVCNYKTKVRTNMYRHLQLHKQEVDVASVDPVNPVPCLEKNEKHFDKMLNLACSSNATNGGGKPKDTVGVVKIPMFVPDMRRFVCGHPGCTYLTITDYMLRSHLNALHCGEKGYQCPHCQEDICKKTMCAERIVQHLKFHGPKIYQCGECEYLHYTKHVVERHVHDKHSAVPFINLITYDRTEKEVNKTMQLVGGRNVTSTTLPSTEEESSEPTTSIVTPQVNKFKWECALCKHQTVTWNQMISHANSAHRAKHQYNCVHCSFGSAHLQHIMAHIDAKHPTKTREAKYVFYKIDEMPQDKAADTRPLWSRDDPKRVRSIRGILMENEEDAERTKQSLSNAGVDLDDEDDDVEIVQVIESDKALKPDVLGCFHCDFKTEDITALTNHWKAKHWHLNNNQLVPKLPFFFRILSVLKCPSCSFVGDYVQLQLHAFNKHAQRTFCAADPNLPNTCGHCPFVYPPKRLEVLTRHYHREHKPTDIKNLSTTMLKSVLTLGECQVYLQCYFCAEICADKTAIINHERDRHGSSNFRYKQIKDDVIYRCGMCQYSSTNELATLRHMIDHYGGFIHCHFCMEDQSGFNAYMHHCYIEHPKDLKGFKEVYPLADITTFLGQMLLIFPNGLIVNKRNLMHTQYGSTEKIRAMYDEICKKALEPPIPPLCVARLMAKKSIEAKESIISKPLLAPPATPVTAKRIAKRRSTVALGMSDGGLSNLSTPCEPQRIRKRKASISDDRPVPPAPLFRTITARLREEDNCPIIVGDDPLNIETVSEGVSFYGKQPEPVDLSKIYTQIAIGDKYAPVSVKKFALLFKMNARVIVEKMNFEKHKEGKRKRTISRPCPASRKKFV